MPRTRGNLSRKATGEKMPSKVSALKSGICSKGKGNPCKARPTPAWQKEITQFFPAASGPSTVDKECASELAADSTAMDFSGNASTSSVAGNSVVCTSAYDGEIKNDSAFTPTDIPEDVVLNDAAAEETQESDNPNVND